MLRALAVNRTLMLDAERARLPPPDFMSGPFDLQPAIAACRAASAGSQMLLVQPIARQKREGKTKSKAAVYPLPAGWPQLFCADCEVDHIHPVHYRGNVGFTGWRKPISISGLARSL